ncbi:MAG TPA: glycine cleavage T C-terminal barrel domain-containing protein [Acidimicrobiales bacterium]|nr:glycine cleavage T C-terminal barrel domain-containing protein [Acidimicrobiales bacterium]
MTDRPRVADPELLADYAALRTDVGARRLPRDFLRVSGPQALEYLEGQCSQELSGIAVGEGADSLLLAPDGKIVALIRVSRTGEDELVLDVDAGFGELVQARLARFKLRTKFEMEPVPWSCLALRGPNAPVALRGPNAPAVLRGPNAPAALRGPNAPAVGGGPGLVLPVSWNGWNGFDLLGPEAAALPEGVRWCGSEAWEACRIEAGVPRMGTELNERTIAAEAGLVERTVSFTKGCYTGQELVARLDSRGSKVARRLCAIVPGSGMEQEPASLVGARLTTPDGAKEVGRITSAAWCPGVGGPAGLAFVHRSVETGGRVMIEVPPEGGVPGPVPAEVRSLPLA